ncbi:MAG: type II secretion system protein J [Dehalococcoidia bacterium]
MKGLWRNLVGLLPFLAADAYGSTLVEVVVAVGITTLAVGMVGKGIFQVFSLERSWRERITATREVRQAFTWFARDALNTSSLTLQDGAPPAQAVTLSWTDRNGALHSVTYSLSGGLLVREESGVQGVLARNVTAGGFSLSGGVLTFQLEVQTPRGIAKEGALQTYLRRLE